MPSFANIMNNKEHNIYKVKNQNNNGQSEYPYATFCSDETGPGVYTTFGNHLQCNGKTRKSWHEQKIEYEKRFRNGKRCLQNRIMRMTRYRGNSANNRIRRQTHIYPIQVAYTFAKDCLKKFAPDSNATTQFRKSVNDLIHHANTIQTNITGPYGFRSNDIEQSINQQTDNRLKSIIKDVYGYTTEEWNNIYKGRKACRQMNLTGLSENECKYIYKYQNNYFKNRNTITNKTRKNKNKNNQ